MQPILRINLSISAIDEYIVPRQWEVDYLGGASLGARLLYEELTPTLDPLSAEAPLLFLNGPLSGTSGPAVGRFVICAKSPATGLWGESNCGGFWGPELRMAGYDGLWITGKADSPVYISIINGKVDIHPAMHIWGMDTYSTQVAVKAELDAKNPRVAVIGPAGESGIPFALILTDHGRVAGRTGMGAVMGAKNLKAVAVKGNGKVQVADEERYALVRSIANRELKVDSYTALFHELGTAGAVDYMDYLAEMPKRYFQNGEYEDALNISGASIAESILTGTSACHACVIACGRVVRLEDGEKRKGPEYETLAGFGPNLWYDDPVRITMLGELCDRYGMDTISISNTIGLAFKLYEMGVITQEEAGGIALEWGNPTTLETLIHQTAHKEGLGKWIAKGSRELGKHFGCEEDAVQVNGLEVPYHDPRGSSGMALVYATSPRGACHNQSDYFVIDMGQVITSLGMEPVGRQAGAEKARNVAIHQDWRTIANSLVLCVFANVPVDTVLDLINAACGLDWKVEDLKRTGERGWNLKRAINNRLGLTRKNEKLPNAFLQPYSDHPAGADGFVPDFDKMLEAYYEVRGWDPKTGVPKKEKLRTLGLEWLVEDLW
ncbi:MAG: aldehyde ferredoxin oxidoreductase family protein [Anaerolineales bacterium]|jgi:aldehyde:ferredoxin oxidoreductase